MMPEQGTVIMYSVKNMFWVELIGLPQHRFDTLLQRALTSLESVCLDGSALRLRTEMTARNGENSERNPSMSITVSYSDHRWARAYFDDNQALSGASISENQPPGCEGMAVDDPALSSETPLIPSPEGYTEEELAYYNDANFEVHHIQNVLQKHPFRYECEDCSLSVVSIISYVFSTSAVAFSVITAIFRWLVQRCVDSMSSKNQNQNRSQNNNLVLVQHTTPGPNDAVVGTSAAGTHIV